MRLGKMCWAHLHPATLLSSSIHRILLAPSPGWIPAMLVPLHFWSWVQLDARLPLSAFVGHAGDS